MTPTEPQEVSFDDEPQEVSFNDEPRATVTEVNADDIAWSGEPRAPREMFAVAPNAEQLAADAERRTHAALTRVVESTRIDASSGQLASTLRNTLVVDADSYRIVATALTGVKAMQKEIEAAFDPIIDAQRKALDAARAVRGRYLDPLLDAEKTAKLRLAAYDTEQERITLEAQKKAEREEEERARAQQLLDAAEAERDGRPEDAALIMTQPVQAAPVAVRKATPTVKGVTTLDEWHGEVTDLVALLTAAVAELRDADKLKPRPHFALFNQPAVLKVLTAQANSAARRDKENCRLTGVRAWKTKGVRSAAK